MNFTNRLIQGDNLETLKSIADNSVDLVYLDPPFFSNREYETFWGDETDEKTVDDVWRISMLQPADKKERIGYPTQKTEALLERIIALASNEGDIVLDPFVGGGTTVAVADRMNRRWIGIDISVSAISVTDLRLQKQRGMFSKPYVIENRIWDYDELNNMNPFEFEQLVVKAFGGVPNEKQRHDFGLDGRMPDGIPLQVKQQNNVVRGEIDKCHLTLTFNILAANTSHLI